MECDAKKYVDKLKKQNVKFLIVSGDIHQVSSDYDKTIEFLNQLVDELCLSIEKFLLF